MRGRVVTAVPLDLAVGPLWRARGLLGAPPDDRALLLVPCDDVHTVGMRHAIDVAFVDRSGKVVEAHRGVGPMRRLRNRRAAAVVERFSGAPGPWFEEGDQLGLVAMKGE